MKLSRRRFVSGLGPAIVTRAQRQERPNLLFLLADDHAAYVMGSDGNSQAGTPNLDRLAQEGAQFSRHYCNSPVCTPSRQSLLTGQMPHAAGVTRLQTSLASDRPTLARQLKQAGYQTAVFGKMHFNRPGTPGLHGFDICETEDVITRDWQRLVKPSPPPEGVATKQLPWRPFQTHAREWLNAGTLPYPRRDSDMRGTYIARRAMEYLEEKSDRPFALWVSFQEPHSPFDFPVEDAAAFRPDRVVVPRIGPQDAWQIPNIFRDLTTREKQGIIAAYYTSARFLDRNVGRVLAKLRDPRLDESTLVVYSADHGYNLGHHGRFEKHCGYEPALRVPLVLWHPGRVKPGRIDQLTEHVDLGPALLNLLNAPPFVVQHGQDLSMHLRGSSPKRGRSEVVSEYLENEEVFVRTKRWKLIYCSGRRVRLDGYETDNPTPGRSIRLFDLQNDPDEYTDVASRNPHVVNELKEVALTRFRQTHPDAGREPSRTDVDDLLDFYVRPRDPDPPEARSPR